MHVLPDPGWPSRTTFIVVSPELFIEMNFFNHCLVMRLTQKIEKAARKWRATQYCRFEGNQPSRNSGGV
jgi:hypothetical protein